MIIAGWESDVAAADVEGSTVVVEVIYSSMDVVVVFLKLYCWPSVELEKIVELKKGVSVLNVVVDVCNDVEDVLVDTTSLVVSEPDSEEVVVVKGVVVNDGVVLVTGVGVVLFAGLAEVEVVEVRDDVDVGVGVELDVDVGVEIRVDVTDGVVVTSPPTTMDTTAPGSAVTVDVPIATPSSFAATTTVSAASTFSTMLTTALLPIAVPSLLCTLCICRFRTSAW